jgi:hypothetical protein
MVKTSLSLGIKGLVSKLNFDHTEIKMDSFAKPIIVTTVSPSLIMTIPTGELELCKGKCGSRLRLKCDVTRTETRFRLSAKRTSPFKSAGASVQWTAGSRVVRISGSNAGYTMFRGSVKSTDYPLHSPVSPSLPLPCVTVCHHISAGLYFEPTVNVT